MFYYYKQLGAIVGHLLSLGYSWLFFFNTSDYIIKLQLSVRVVSE